jgi:pimeloyl-ACP methyl ester carboxylesterase
MKSHATALVVTLLTLGVTFPLHAQGLQDPLTGAWEGTLTVPGAALTIVFHFSAEDGSYSGTMDSPDQGAVGIPLGNVTLINGQLVAMVPSAAGEYRGELSDDGTIAGTWSQAGQSFPLNLARAAQEEKEVEETPMTRPDLDVRGSWLGRLQTPGDGPVLRVVFNIRGGDDGALTGTLDSPDQGARDIPLGEISGSGSSVVIDVPAVMGSYQGTIEADRSSIKGTWTQGGMDMPLTLEPADEESLRMPERPQDPKPPYPYREENVTFDNIDAGVKLAGTLTLPEGAGPFPSAILITGSGPQNRDEELMGHKPFLVLADHLTRQGIVVLRYDDRGVGESTGEFATATSVDFAADASAAVDYLKTRLEVDVERIGLVGHSEGALIAPIVAIERDDVGFLVLMAGPGVTGAEIILEQSALIARAAGADEDVISQQQAAQKSWMEIAMSDLPQDEAQDKLRQNLRDRFAEMNEGGFSEEMIEVQVSQTSSPWMRYFLSYDPRPKLEKVTCPTLAINGEKDLQVPPYQNLPEIEKALKAGGNSNFRIVELEGLNHLFQRAETGAPLEYAQIEMTFAPEALRVISDWILEVAS